MAVYEDYILDASKAVKVIKNLEDELGTSVLKKVRTVYWNTIGITIDVHNDIAHFYSNKYVDEITEKW